MRACAEHLRQYNEGLGLSNTFRMWDALNFLSKYHEEEMKKKTAPDEEHVIQITDTERFLFNLFKGKSFNTITENDFPLIQKCQSFLGL